MVNEQHHGLACGEVGGAQVAGLGAEAEAALVAGPRSKLLASVGGRERQ